MMKVFFTVLCLICSLTLFSFQRLDDYLGYALEKSGKIAEKIAEENGIQLGGMGYGNRDYIETIGLEFNSERELGVAEVRKLTAKESFVPIFLHFL